MCLRFSTIFATFFTASLGIPIFALLNTPILQPFTSFRKCSFTFTYYYFCQTCFKISSTFHRLFAFENFTGFAGYRHPEVSGDKIPIPAAMKVCVDKIGSVRRVGQFLSRPFWWGSRDPSIPPNRQTHTFDHLIPSLSALGKFWQVLPQRGDGGHAVGRADGSRSEQVCS